MDEKNYLFQEIDRLSREVDGLERKLSALSPEAFVQLQVHLAVLENSLTNLKGHIDSKHRDHENDLDRLEKDKVAKHEVKIPHLLIYAIAGSFLMATLWIIFDKLGLPRPSSIPLIH